jgi:shikimate dehydrogenase
MTAPISGATAVAGVVGAPIRHSLSPRLHNAWLAAAGIDAVYVAFSTRADRFAAFVDGLRGGTVLGLNVTAPFKAEALILADTASDAAARAGAANLLLFGEDGSLAAENTDGEGFLAAFAAQAAGFDPTAWPAVILGAGGAARGAAAALLAAGCPEVRIACRDPVKGEALTRELGGRARLAAPGRVTAGLEPRVSLINATPAGLEAAAAARVDPMALPPGAVVMDMVYAPLETPLLLAARRRGLATVDGLAMLIGQARPSFTALFGAPPPPIDVRALALQP